MLLSTIFAIFRLYTLIELIQLCTGVIYTYEDVELRRIFPSEFPQDVIRRSGSMDPEHLGRYAELESYFKSPKSLLNRHFEELACYERQGQKVCEIDQDRHRPEEDDFYLSSVPVSNVDDRRVYCLLMTCFTEVELNRVVGSF